MESNQPFGFFRPALIRLSYPTEVERAVRLELTNTGFAIRRLSRLATRANWNQIPRPLSGRMSKDSWHLVTWNGRRDSNSRVEFGRLACFQLHHFRKWNSRQDSNPHHRRSKRRALPIEPQERKVIGRGGQSRTVTTSAQDSDASVTPHPDSWRN